MASQSEVESKGEAVMAAWEDLFDSDSLRRPASWIDLPIEAPTVPGLPNGWTALDILVNNKARVRPRMVQMLLEARADMARPSWATLAPQCGWVTWPPLHHPAGGKRGVGVFTRRGVPFRR